MRFSNLCHFLVDSITCLPLQVKVNKLEGTEEIFPHFVRGHSAVGVKNSVNITFGGTNNVVFFHVGGDIPGGLRNIKIQL